MPKTGSTATSQSRREERIVVYGAAGFATIAVRCVQEVSPNLRPVAFVDDFDNGRPHPDFDAPVVSETQRARDFPDLPVLLAVNEPSSRETIAARLAEAGASLWSFAGDPLAVADDFVIGDGSYVDHRTRVGPRVSLGRGVAALGQLIAHDNVIGDFTTIGPTATVLGHVRIGARVKVAPGAIIRNGTPRRDMVIGDDAVIGVGAVVTKPVRAGEVIIGNPGMTLDRWRTLQRLINAHHD